MNTILNLIKQIDIPWEFTAIFSFVGLLMWFVGFFFFFDDSWFDRILYSIWLIGFSLLYGYSIFIKKVI